jgi:hypothetical protein
MSSFCKCGLDFERLKVLVSVKVLSDLGAINMNGVPLYCPACGTRNLLNLQAYGFFYWKGRFFRWRSANVKGDFRDERRLYEIKAGQLTLRFPGELIADDKFTVEQMCYAAVPVFKQLADEPSVPKLPVKREYLDLVETAEGVVSERTVKGEYRFRFKLKVLEDPVEVTRPAVMVEPDAFNSEDVFGGVHLALWPDINFKDWRRYFLRFGCESNYFNKLASQTRSTSVWAYACPDLNRDPSNKEWIALSSTPDDGRTRYACVESRPEWIAVEIEDKGRGELGGGIWNIAPATESYATGQPVTVGVDFGTSSTCLAWSTAEGLDLLPISDHSRYIIRGSKLPDKLTYVDTWPPRRGFGKHSALLPTEILTLEKLNDLRTHSNAIVNWKPVVDYSIPSGGLEVEYKEQEHVIADFKWEEMIADPELRGYSKELQKRYLEFALLVAMAELAAHKSLRAALHLNFSFPLAFDPAKRTAFEEVLAEVAHSVNQQTGVQIENELALDEARAAARYAGTPGGKDAACLYVDIGGGSTDIALLKLGGGHLNKDQYMYVCSFKYAGGGLVSALAKGGCLVPGSDIAHFRRKVREIGSVKELMDKATVFLDRKKNAIEAKSSYFYGYLRQFLARLVAAHIISGEWKGSPNGEVEVPSTERPTYRIMLYTLGNGWGFGGFIDTYFADRFSEKLTDEVNLILDEAITRNIIPPASPRVEVESSAPENPKAAVAHGVISVATTKDVAPAKWNARTILGWTTHVGISQSIPWYQEIIEGNSKPPKGYENKGLQPHSSVECPPDEWPPFPRSLPLPHDLDEGLKHTRQFLSQCSPQSAGKEWFVASPFHVLLEKLFKPKLEELS